MKPSTTFLFATITGLFLTLGSCVAEKDFDNSAFESVSPEVGTNDGSLDELSAEEETGEIYNVKFETSKGDFVIEVHTDWAPLGAGRFKELVEGGVYDDARFFRVLDGFMAQFGIAGDPKISANWKENPIEDERPRKSNTRGMITYAKGGPNSRTCQVFISYGNNARLDSDGFAPFGKVIDGMDVVDSLYSGYGEGAPNGNGPGQGQIQAEGNAYLMKDFPKLDYIKKATIIKEENGAPSE